MKLTNRLCHSCFIWLLLTGTLNHSLAQCPARQKMWITLQRLSATNPREQVRNLQNWQRQWRQCGYPADSTYIDGLLQLGLSHQASNEFELANQIGRQAVQLCQLKRPDRRPDQPAKAYYRLGMVLSYQRQSAIETLRQAVRLGQGIRLADRWVGAAYLFLAYGYYSTGEFQKALSCVENGERIVEKTTDRSLLTRLLEEKIKSLNELGAYDLARQTAERALTLARQDDYPAVVARAYQLLSAIAEKQQQLGDALRFAQLAFAIARKNKDISAPNYSVSVGLIYRQLHRYKEAIPCFQYGLDSSTNAYDQAYALAMLGRICSDKKEYVKALQYYQRGLNVMPLGFQDSTITHLPAPRTMQLADQKEYLLTLIQNKANTWLEYAKATNHRQRLQYALDAYDVADKMVDLMRWEHTGQDTKLYWRQTTRGMYERAIETCYRLGSAQQAFRFMEKSRAVMLTDKLNELGARQKLTQAQLNRQERLQEAVRSSQQVFANANTGDSATYQSIRMALLTRQDSLNDFIRQLEVSNRAYYQIKYNNAVLSLAQMQRYLNDQSASFVTYFVGDSALYLLGVTGNSAVLRKQPVKIYKESLDPFAQLLSRPEAMHTKTDVSRFLSLSHRLFEQLLAPLSLPAGRVIVSPDGFFVPFDAFSRSPTEAQYAVDDYAFSYTYSASLLVKNGENQRQTADWRTGDFLGVAPVRFAPSLGQVRLPDSDKALESIAKRFSSPLLLTHEKATRRAFLEKAATTRIIQLFTHAAADSAGQEPMLFFADSTLKLSDFSDGALPNTQLVVLTACKTGIGVNQRGEGVFSLGRGFAALGVPCVLTTLWSVQNQATYRLTELFHIHINEGASKDLALQQAKRDWLREAGTTDRLPNYWAGLIIVGDTVPLRQTDVSPWIVVSVLLALAGLGSLFWYRQKRRSRYLVS